MHHKLNTFIHAPRALHKSNLIPMTLTAVSYLSLSLAAESGLAASPGARERERGREIHMCEDPFVVLLSPGSHVWGPPSRVRPPAASDDPLHSSRNRLTN